MDFVSDSESGLEDWPMSKLKQNLEYRDMFSSSRLPMAVLLTTGSLNPIHVGHLQCMEDARMAIEKNGFNVIAGFISPSSDIYVRSKMENFARKNSLTLNSVFANGVQRIRLTQLACLESDWLSCSSWEANRPRFADFDEVTYNLDCFLRHNNYFTTDLDSVFYVCGSDHYNKCGLNRGLYTRLDRRYRHVAVCVRSGEGGADILTPPASPLVIVVNSTSTLNERPNAKTDSTTPCEYAEVSVVGSVASLSSTQIRALLNTSEQGDPLPASVDVILRLALPPHVYTDITNGEGMMLYRK